MGSLQGVIMWSRVAVLLSLTAICHAGLLGAGTGDGSCAAAPFRSTVVSWAGGCPAHASCCSEFGYCRGREEWEAGYFRDCNGESNGRPLESAAIAAERAAVARGDSSGASLIVVPAGQNTASLIGAPPSPASAAALEIGAGGTVTSGFVDGNGLTGFGMAGNGPAGFGTGSGTTGSGAGSASAGFGAGVARGNGASGNGGAGASGANGFGAGSRAAGNGMGAANFGAGSASAGIEDAGGNGASGNRGAGGIFAGFSVSTSGSGFAGFGNGGIGANTFAPGNGFSQYSVYGTGLVASGANSYFPALYSKTPAGTLFFQPGALGVSQGYYAINSAGARVVIYGYDANGNAITGFDANGNAVRGNALSSYKIPSY